MAADASPGASPACAVASGSICPPVKAGCSVALAARHPAGVLEAIKTHLDRGAEVPAACAVTPPFQPDAGPACAGTRDSVLDTTRERPDAVQCMSCLQISVPGPPASQDCAVHGQGVDSPPPHAARAVWRPAESSGELGVGGGEAEG